MIENRYFNGKVTRIHLNKILRHFKLKRNSGFSIVAEELPSGDFYLQIFKIQT